MNQNAQPVFAWGPLVATDPCAADDQRIIREARERGPTYSPRGAYPRKLVPKLVDPDAEVDSVDDVPEPTER